MMISYVRNPLRLEDLNDFTNKFIEQISLPAITSSLLAVKLQTKHCCYGFSQKAKAMARMRTRICAAFMGAH